MDTVVTGELERTREAFEWHEMNLSYSLAS